MAYTIVYYINQFFAGMGGEEQAHTPPEIRDGAVGPAQQMEKLLGGDAKVEATVICGDSFYGEHTDEARARCLEMIKANEPDLFVAGPAFNAGRYGFACGDISAAVAEELGIPTLTGMYEENPGVELYAAKTFIVKVSDSARGMRKALPAMATLVGKLMRSEELGPADEEGYISRGMRKNFFHETNGAHRAVDMLLRKIKGEPFTTEYGMPVFNRVDPAPAVQDLGKARIALVCSGGIVPMGNPDHIRVSSAEKYGEYDIGGVDSLSPEAYESIHGGYDRVYANKNPNVVLPVDVLRDFEKQGRIGELHNTFYTTTGTGTSVANAERFGREIGEKLKAEGVDAVILTST